MRRTKIVATLGPSSNSEEMIMRMLMAGVNVVRLNFSHGQMEEHIACADIVRKIAKKLGVTVGILCDLQGPKIRIGKFADNTIHLADGDMFTLDVDCKLGDNSRVGLDYHDLPKEVEQGTVLLLDDGRVVLTVQAVHHQQIDCVVTRGGSLSNNKGINKQGGGLSAQALTQKDRQDIQVAVALQADFLAVSFPRCADDIVLARHLMQEAGGHAHIVAKMERAEAIDVALEIIMASDVVMVARGDLGVEVGDARIPAIQKHLIRLARAHHKSVIIATQMMESMIHSPIPTRAEVSDVANAVLDGADAVMLSAETATGRYPLQTIESVHRVILDAEKESFLYTQPNPSQAIFSKTDESIAMAAIYIAQHLQVKAIATLTQSGNTARWLSHADNTVPIYALSPDETARRKLTICRGIYPYAIIQTDKTRDEILREMEKVLFQYGMISVDDLVILTFGEPLGELGSTNILKIVQIKSLGME